VLRFVNFIVNERDDDQLSTPKNIVTSPSPAKSKKCVGYTVAQRGDS